MLTRNVNTYLKQNDGWQPVRVVQCVCSVHMYKIETNWRSNYAELFLYQIPHSRGSRVVCKSYANEELVCDCVCSATWGWWQIDVKSLEKNMKDTARKSANQIPHRWGWGLCANVRWRWCVTVCSATWSMGIGDKLMTNLSIVSQDKYERHRGEIC